MKIDLLKKYDEFDFAKKDKFRVLIDSKENLENNYLSSWYYYYKLLRFSMAPLM